MSLSAQTLQVRERAAGGRPPERTIQMRRCLEFPERHGLAEKVAQIDLEGLSGLALDLSQLEHVNVVTISAILHLHEMLDSHGKALRICGCCRQVFEALRYLGLHRLMPLEPQL
jgi:anti-anti-sigma regulatory factor